jgi:hypothetical protein
MLSPFKIFGNNQQTAGYTIINSRMLCNEMVSRIAWRDSYHGMVADALTGVKNA